MNYLVKVDRHGLIRKTQTVSYDNVELYSCRDMNLGQATKYGLSMAQTEWVAIIRVSYEMDGLRI